MISANIALTQTVIVAGVITTVVSVLTAYIYQNIKKNRYPTEWEAVGKVTKMCIFPFKSARRIEVKSAECTKQGLMELEKNDKSLRLRDRAFVVYHAENYEYRSAKHYAELTLIEIEARDANHVTINGPDMKTLILRIPTKLENKEVTIKHFQNEEIVSIDCGDEAAAWISQYMGKDKRLRIAYHDGSYKRTQINKLYKSINDYYKKGLRNESGGLNSDLTAMHIINNASVLDMQKRVGNSEVTVDNFRPNLVIDGPNLKPYVEDNWEWIKVGDVVMKTVVECPRCSVPTINMDTGIRRKDQEPLKTLGKFRMAKGPYKWPVMGLLLEVFETGLISVGDTVYVGKNS